MQLIVTAVTSTVFAGSIWYRYDFATRPPGSVRGDWSPGLCTSGGMIHGGVVMAAQRDLSTPPRGTLDDRPVTGQVIASRAGTGTASAIT